MMKRKSNFAYRFAVILVIALCTGNAWAQKYISDVYICEENDKTPEGYTRLDQDLNEGVGGKYIYLCVKKTDNPYDAITDLRVAPYSVSDVGWSKAGYSEHSEYGNLNAGITSYEKQNLYLLYTKTHTYRNSSCAIGLLSDVDFIYGKDISQKVPENIVRRFDSGAPANINQLLSGSTILNSSLYMIAKKTSFVMHSDVQDVPYKAPTCTEKGNVQFRQCMYCGETETGVPLSDYELQPLGHDYVSKPNCVTCLDEEKCLFHFSCARDAKHQESKTIKMLCARAEDDNCKIVYYYFNNAAELKCIIQTEHGLDTLNFKACNHYSMKKGEHIWYYGNNPSGFSTSKERFNGFDMYGSFTLSGPIMSLIDEKAETMEIPNNYCFYKLFSGCKDLKTAPKLTATILKEGCYASMFEDCTNLTVAPPILPALTLVKDCYTDMFKGCTSLTVAPELPATTLVDNCYTGMFKGCSNLVVAPKLPATTLTENCYAYMFEGCSSLAVAPELPATTLTTRCYAYMFQGCSGLTAAPELPATTLTTRCYDSMFAGCSNLIAAPELPATTLADMCYSYMFNGCSKLKSLTLGATGVDSKFYMYHWLDGTASSGGGIVYVNDQMILNVDAGNAELYLPVNWRTNKLVFHPYEDPDTPGKYYGTFCDSDDEYTVKAGTKLYTAEEINTTSKEVKMHETGNDIIPAGEMVITVGDTPNVILTLSDTGAAKDEGNLLKGSDIDITIPGNSYYFTRGQYGIGFYPFIGETIKPRMAYVTNAAMRGSKIFYPDFGENASQSTVGSINIATEEGSVRNSFCIAPGMNTKITLVDNGGLTLNDKHGTIGTLYGREAMVLDLGGSVGRVAVATKNVGVTADGYIDIHRQNSDPYKGTTYIFEEVNNYWTNTLTGGWHVPTVEELQLLTDKLDLDSRYICLKWDISDSKTLWIPGYIDSNGNRGGMYAGVKLGDDSYAGLEFIFTENGYSYKMAYEDGLGYWDELECVIRPFHCLKSNNKCLKIESDNGVARTYDINSDLKLSFTPNASPAAMKIVFNDNAPIETEHGMEGIDISFSDDGESLYMTVNGEQVTYALDDIKEITFFDGTPSVQLTANQDPDHAGNYYTTFYSGLEAYILPEGVKAYTAKMEDSGNETIVRMKAIEGDVIPQGEAVLLYTQNGSNITMTTTNEAGTKADVNQFKGVDVAKEQTGVNYMLSYGQNGLGFYKMNSSMLLAANKAFLSQSANNAKAMRMVFDDEEVTGIENVNDNDALRYDDNNIYSVSGIRLNQLQKGINIVNGKKIIVK